VVFLWLQDIGVVVAEAVAFTWLCELAGRVAGRGSGNEGSGGDKGGRDAAWLAAAGLILLVANPWTWWSVSFDFHTETLAIPFAALLAWDLSHGRRRAWVWVAPLLACGAIAATYAVGLGLGGALTGLVRGREGGRWLRGVVIAALGAGAMLAMTLIHGDKGSNLQSFAYLAAAPADSQLSLVDVVKGIALHPVTGVRVFWDKRLDLWANMAPGGIAGIGFVAVLPVLAVVLVTNNLFNGWLFAAPSFQGLPIYVFLPVGTVAVLGWLMRRYRRAALLLSGLAVMQALAWTAAVGPQTSSHWLLVSSPAAATLADISARIPASAGVIASQGVVGRFSGRTEVEALYGPGSEKLTLSDRETWFVIAPSVGSESQTAASAGALIEELASGLHATLVMHANGVWAFRWRPPAGMRTFRVPGAPAVIPAWALAGAAAKVVTSGPVADWHVTGSGGPGYVADGLSWREPAGRYAAQVTLSAAGGPVSVEVWNDTSNTLLARQNITATSGVETLTLGADVPVGSAATAYVGRGPFRAEFVPPPAGNLLEVRVWSASGAVVNVFSAGLVRRLPSWGAFRHG
jgi:hypothetical protein